uniref:CACTA en-spm transposon protein n=1 Tax=Macrostomum lignano TaxID=282301 RepID=A0A1I8HYK9_9PLAT
MQLTILCDFFHCMLRLGGRTVQLRMWDTGGMERFEAMNLASNFYRKRSRRHARVLSHRSRFVRIAASLVGTAPSQHRRQWRNPAKVASSNAAWLATRQMKKYRR